MLKMDIKLLIRDLVPSLLGKHWKNYSKEHIAVKFGFDCQFDDYKIDSHLRRTLYVLVTSRHEVYYYIEDFADKSPRNWIFSSAHDSCWSDMSFISQFYFDCCDIVNPNIPPRDVNTFISLVPWDNLFKTYAIVTKRQKGEHYEREIINMFPYEPANVTD